MGIRTQGSTYVLDHHDRGAHQPYRNLKVARTIADLEACADVLDHHIMEAIAYRNLDRPTYLGSF
ncbi:MAG: hypothetical protein II905_10690 [Muribaculaceae bacterium]|nr:hypothetical protein [Muribaculaceae bacterium]